MPKKCWCNLNIYLNSFLGIDFNICCVCCVCHRLPRDNDPTTIVIIILTNLNTWWFKILNYDEDYNSLPECHYSYSCCVFICNSARVCAYLAANSLWYLLHITPAALGRNNDWDFNCSFNILLLPILCRLTSQNHNSKTLYEIAPAIKESNTGM